MVWTSQDPERYNVTAETVENATIIRRYMPVDVQNEDRFSPMNTFAYSPFAQDLLSYDNAILAFILVKIAKSDPKLLAQLAGKYMDNTTKLLMAIVESGKAHPLTALNASTAFAVVAHRFGIITDSGCLKMLDQTRSIIDKLIQLNFANVALEGIGTLVEAGAKVAGTVVGLPSK